MLAQYLKPNTRTINTKCRVLVQLIAETLLSLVFHSIAEVSFPVPQGTVKNLTNRRRPELGRWVL